MSLEEKREEIDRIDEEIVRLIGERLKAAESIGQEKSQLGLPVTDSTREKVVLERVRELARKANINEDGIENLYKEIMRLAKSVEGGVSPPRARQVHKAKR